MTDAASPPLLVLGASSLIGRFLPDAAGARRLIGVSRAAREGDGFEWRRIDLANPSATLPQSTAVVACCPIGVLAPALPALDRAGVRRIVAFSSTSRWTKFDSPEADERAVAARLAAGEQALQRFAEAQGWRWTVLRPTLIYAEGRDRNVSRLADLARRWGVLPLAGDGRGLRQPVHAQDLATAALTALARPATFGRAYDLPGGETLTYRAMTERVFHGLGRHPRVVAVPPQLWRLGRALAGAWLPGSTAAMGARMMQDLTFDGSAAVRDFGWAPRAFAPKFTRTAVGGNR